MFLQKPTLVMGSRYGSELTSNFIIFVFFTVLPLSYAKKTVERLLNEVDKIIQIFKSKLKHFAKDL